MPNRFIPNRVNITNIFPDKEDKTRRELKKTLIFSGFFLAIIIILASFSIKRISYPYPNLVALKNRNNKKNNNDINLKIKDFGIKIEKIKVLAPVVKNVDGSDKKIYNEELKKGVAHLKGSAFPGEGSNVFIFGHSSGLVGYGLYSKVFSRLDNLKRQDKITIFYKNNEFSYFVFKKEIVDKDDISVIKPTKTEQLTLMTCWPIGTNKKRLIIEAKPIQ